MENNTVRRKRRMFTSQFKADVVGLYRQGEKSVGAIARDLDLNETSVRRWVTQADIDSGLRDGLTTADREEMASLKKQVRILTEERDILKRATVFFAKEIR